jgi:hypothetical protein
MVAESAEAPVPAGPEDPQATSEIDNAAAETAIPAVRNLRLFMCSFQSSFGLDADCPVVRVKAALRGLRINFDSQLQQLFEMFRKSFRKCQPNLAVARITVKALRAVNSLHFLSG